MVEDMYRRYGSIVLRRARVLLRDDSAARDAMQEVFVRALQASESFRRDASPVTWLYRITTNYCLNLLRDSRRHRELLEEQGPTPDAAPDGSPETRVILAQILRRAPPELREIAVYYYMDRMSHEEIAAMLGVSRRTVGNRLDAFRSAMCDAPEAR